MPLIDYVDVDPGEREHYDKRSLYKGVERNNREITRIHDQLHYELLDAGPVDEEMFEYIMVAVAQANECDYCAASHRENVVKSLGRDREVLTSLKENDFSVVPDRIRPVIEFASKAASNPHRIVAADLERLYDIGFDESAVIQLLAVIGYCGTCNLIVSALGVDPGDRDADLPTF